MKEGGRLRIVRIEEVDDDGGEGIRFKVLLSLLKFTQFLVGESENHVFENCSDCASDGADENEVRGFKIKNDRIIHKFK